jgi:hypothetical protein
MNWKLSNAEQMIPREKIYGIIHGVDFGPSVFVIARSPKSMLLWLGGHTWSLNGSNRYSESHLTLIKNRSRMDGWRNYMPLEPHGGRLTVARLESAKPKICEIFNSHWVGICHAVDTKQTLLIEGGGNRPQPASSLGREAYLTWLELQPGDTKKAPARA